jgi:hypothetical protein
MDTSWLKAPEPACLVCNRSEWAGMGGNWGEICGDCLTTLDLHPLFPHQDIWKILCQNENGPAMPYMRVKVSALALGEWGDGVGSQLYYSSIYMLWTIGIKQRVAEKRKMRLCDHLNSPT